MLKNEERAVLKRYIDNYLSRFITIPIDIYTAVVRNFPDDYNLEELTGMLNLRSTVVNSLDKVVEDNNIDIFVDNLTKYNHPDLLYFWNLLSKTYASFSQLVIDKYVDNWDWNVISELNPSEEFIDNNLIHINWDFVSCGEKILGFFQKYENVINFNKVDWGTLGWDVVKNYIHKIKDLKFKTNEDEKGLVYGKCTNEFIEQYKEFVPVMTIAEIISKSMDNIPSDWESISQYYQIDEELIDYCSHRIDWDLVSASQVMSLDLMLKFKDKIKVDQLNKNIKISQEIKDEFISQKNEVIPEISDIDNCKNCGKCDKEIKRDDGSVERDDDGSAAVNITFIFTDEKLEKEIEFSLNLNKDPNKVKDFYELIEAIENTYGSFGKELMYKKLNGHLTLKYMIKNVDMDTLNAEIEEFLTERGWVK